MSDFEEYARLNIIDDRDADFSQWVTPEDKSLIKSSSEYQDEVETLLREGEKRIGESLPLKNTTQDFIFRAGELSVYSGYSGHKKSMLQSYIALGLVAQGTRVLIASFEMSPKRTLWRMAKQFSGKSEPDENDLSLFFNFVSKNLYIYDQQGTVSAKKMVGVSRFSIHKLGIKHIFIDSMMKLQIPDDNLNLQKWLVNELSSLARDKNSHIHLVAHSKKPQSEGDERKLYPSKYGVSGSGNITNVADNVLISYSAKKGRVDHGQLEEYSHLLIIEKQRNGELEPTYALDFYSNLQFSRVSEEASTMTPEKWSTCDFN
jgi:twinkle protein